MQRPEWMILADGQILGGHWPVFRTGTGYDHDRERWQLPNALKYIDGPSNINIDGLSWLLKRDSWIALSGQMKYSVWLKGGYEARKMCRVANVASFERTTVPPICRFT